MEAGTTDDIAALELQDAIRHNKLKQEGIQRNQATVARVLARQKAALETSAEAKGEDHGSLLADQSALTEPSAPSASAGVARRRPVCTVRVNNLHIATGGGDSMETDV